MTTPKKPEWFELAESDGGKAHTSVKRSARGALLSLPLLLIGVGVVVAQGTDESPAIAESITTITSAAPSMSPDVALAKPSIATPPTGGENDDDYEDEDENEEEDDD
jgi:hypothetical protein